jgi:cytoskeleton protein RodZ
MTAEDGSTRHTEADNGDGFGVYLKTQRKARGISLTQVAARTNIQPEILVRIETERLDLLPEPVYIKGFVRAYADVIGVDSAEAVLRYERQHAAYRQALSARKHRSRRRLLDRMLVLALLTGGLILAVTVLLPQAPDKDAEKRPAAARDGSSASAPAPNLETTQKPGSAGSASDAGRPLMLTAVGLKETTLKIIVDGERPKVYHLQADTRLEIEAQREFNILVDDARAVSFYLDGQPVAVPGREGQQVTLQLP